MKNRLLFLPLLAVLALAGCEKKNAPTVDDETTLTILVKKSDLGSLYITRIFELYEQQTGKAIKPLPIENADFDREAAKMFQEGRIPDMLLHFNDSELAHFNVAENFYYLNNEPWVSDLTDSTRANCVDSSGNIVGLPFWESSVSGCYYNKTLLAQNGLRAITTQVEFDYLCSTLQNKGYTPMYWAANGCNWLFQFGLDPVFADNPALLERLNKNEIRYADIPAVRDMIAWLGDANKKGWFNHDYAKATWDDIPAAIGSGGALLFFCWDTWFFNELDDSKNVANGGPYKYTMKDFALMPVFMNTVSSGTYEGGNMNMIMVNKNGKKLALALNFLNFCMTPANYNAAFRDVPTVQCFKQQTTNIQAQMVTDVMGSIQANQRVSTAWAKIIGYKQDDVGAAVLKLFRGEVDADGCIALMDECRIAAAKEMGAVGF